MAIPVLSRVNCRSVSNVLNQMGAMVPATPILPSLARTFSALQWQADKLRAHNKYALCFLCHFRKQALLNVTSKKAGQCAQPFY
jgi:hypothetical protein